MGPVGPIDMKPSAETTGSDEMFNRHKSSVSPTCMTTRFILLVPPPARIRVEDQQLPFPYFPNNKFLCCPSFFFLGWPLLSYRVAH